MSSIDFAALFETLPSPHMVLDSRFDVVAVNASYEKAVMRGRGELLGGNLFALFPNDGEGGARVRASLQRVLDTGRSDTIAYIPYEIPRSGGKDGFELRYWTAVHTPLTGADGRVGFIVQNTVDVTDIVMLKEAASLPFRTLPGEAALVQRAQEAENAYRAALAHSADFRRLFQHAPGMIAVLQGAGHVFTFANNACQRFLGARALIGKSLREVLPDIADQGLYELFDKVFAGGTPQLAEGRRIVLVPAEDGIAREAYLDFSLNPIHDAGGAVTGIFVQGNDRTEHFLSLQRQRLLLDELNHRVKNTLATVQSIARQSFRDVDAAAAKASFEARIMALSKTHDVLSERHWETIDLSAILEQELAVFEAGRVEAAGPDVHLSPRAAIAFAMVFHELASNASKYGALSSQEGALHVAWKRPDSGPGGTLALEWRETGGPAAPRPLRGGFGTRMLQRMIEGELDGWLDLDLSDGGLICRLEVAMSEVEYRAAQHR